jgi:molecular chaperone DnaK
VSEPDLQRALAELENRNVLVFDWGGGTLDLNLCRIAGGVIYQISTRGNNEVGGDRFDDRLRNLIRNAHARQRGIEDLKSLEQPGASTKLLNQCELAKIQLSSKQTHIVVVGDYLRGEGAARNLGVTVSREKLQSATQDIIKSNVQRNSLSKTEPGSSNRDAESGDNVTVTASRRCNGVTLRSGSSVEVRPAPNRS